MSGHCEDCGNTLCICYWNKENSVAKTKEIECYVHKNELASFGETASRVVVWSQYPATDTVLKAKLIIEFPERKVTITESDFDDACKDNEALDFVNSRRAVALLKERLFGVGTR
jgi:hypothetical protein